MGLFISRSPNTLCDAPLLLFVRFIAMNCPKLYMAVLLITLISDASRASHPAPSTTQGYRKCRSVLGPEAFVPALHQQ